MLMQLSLVRLVFAPGRVQLFCPDRSVSGDSNQGGEMAVSMTELEGFNLPSVCLHSVVNGVGPELRERRSTLLFPDAVQRLESRR
jgi:hypothetical protein